MRRVIVLLLLFIVVLVSFAVTPLRDVTPTHWAYESIQYLIEKGILTGLPDGSFQGDAALTRYQFSVALFKAMQYFERTGIITTGSNPELATISYQVNTLRGLVETMAASTERLGRDYQEILKRINALGNLTELQNQITQVNTVVSGLETRVISLEMSSGEIIPKISTLERQSGEQRKMIENNGAEMQILNERQIQLTKQLNLLTWVAIPAAVLAVAGVGIGIFVWVTK